MFNQSIYLATIILSIPLILFGRCIKFCLIALYVPFPFPVLFFKFFLYFLFWELILISFSQLSPCRILHWSAPGSWLFPSRNALSLAARFVALSLLPFWLLPYPRPSFPAYSVTPCNLFAFCLYQSWLSTRTNKKKQDNWKGRERGGGGKRKRKDREMRGKKNKKEGRRRINVK